MSEPGEMRTFGFRAVENFRQSDERNAGRFSRPPNILSGLMGVWPTSASTLLTDKEVIISDNLQLRDKERKFRP